MLRKAHKGSPKFTRVDDSIVTCQHSTLHQPSGVVFELTTTLDFTDVSQSDILKLAADTVLIRWRGAFKKAKVSDPEDIEAVAEELSGFNNRRITVAKMLQRSRAKLTPEQRAAKIKAEQSPEVLAALLELARSLDK